MIAHLAALVGILLVMVIANLAVMGVTVLVAFWARCTLDDAETVLKRAHRLEQRAEALIERNDLDAELADLLDDQ